tara:strand:+ start:101 stop:1093 length:993 start_codon:yes stop_codon:yes gene_type:complete
VIIKNFEISKKNLSQVSLFLLYGENDGFKNQLINKNILKDAINVEKYEEKEVFDNYESFMESLLNKSFFDREKNIIISRVTDKLFSFVEELIEKNLEDTKIILKAGKLDKKSKLRNLIEKDKKNVCIPFYLDEVFTLNKIASSFFKENNIEISREALNIIVEKCRGNRDSLNSELSKIKLFLYKKNKIDIDSVSKLVNLSENFSVSELVDNCLAQDKKKLIKIINENNYTHDDCMLILRTLLIKSKRIYQILNDIEKNADIETAIRNFKPIIFWKDKDIVKKQVKIWSKSSIENLIKKANDTELLIKKNSDTSLNFVYDFILNISTNSNN